MQHHMNFTSHILSHFFFTFAFFWQLKEEVAYAYRHTRSDLLALLNKSNNAAAPLLIQAAVQYIAKVCIHKCVQCI